jgi:pimeloyl-ACP methyl ester carboxylesterase
MFVIPTFVLSVWFFGLLSLGLIGGGAYLLWEWYQRAWAYDPQLDRYIFDPNFGFNLPTALLVAGLGLLVWAFAGGLILRWIGSLTSASQTAGDRPRYTRQGRVQRLARPDGSELQVESYGPENGPPIILTHGWGYNSTEWYYLKQQLSDRFRLIVWDLPGLGWSRGPANNDYSPEKFAHDLKAVLELAGDQPAILLGHSIGGMITLTFARLFPEILATRIAGLGLVHTTYTNPVRTTSMASLHTALERPVIVPLLYLTIWLSPLVWLMNWLSYFNGMAHLSNKRNGFAGNETWDQVDFITGYQLQAPPSVLARGLLGLLHYDATETLKTIDIPTLVVPGDQDPICRPEASQRIHQDVRATQLAPLAPAKHLGLIEYHEQFAEIVRIFALACFQAHPAHQPMALAGEGRPSSRTNNSVL